MPTGCSDSHKFCSRSHAASPRIRCTGSLRHQFAISVVRHPALAASPRLFGRPTFAAAPAAPPIHHQAQEWNRASGVEQHGPALLPSPPDNAVS